MMLNKNTMGPRAIAASAALSALLLLSAPSFADETTAPAAPATQTAPAPTKPAVQHGDRVEARITNLHQQLHITAAQETQWSAVAQAMRDNANAIRDLVKDRKAKAASMNAVDDLRSYEAIADAHADGLKKLIPAFETLYTSMSDEQKKVADTLFKHARHEGGTRKG
jgi:protein CpxP